VPAKLQDYTTKEAWLKARYDGLGGSDAGAVMGLNAWKTRDQVLESKTAPYKPKPDTQTKAQKRGHDCEKPIKEMFWLDYQGSMYSDRNRCRQYTILSNTDHPWLMGTPDCELERKDKDGKLTYGVLEIKTGRVAERDYDIFWKHKMPDSYYVQVLHYLLVNDDYKFAILRAYLTISDNNSSSISSRYMRDYYLSRDNKTIAADLELLLVEEVKFWNLVEKGRNDNIPAK